MKRRDHVNFSIVEFMNHRLEYFQDRHLHKHLICRTFRWYRKNEDKWSNKMSRYSIFYENDKQFKYL